ncbi:MAG: phosphate ABC transporter permease subunit PstC [Thermoproteus sp.]
MIFIKLRWGLRLLAFLVPAAVASLVVMFFVRALPAIEHEGLALFTTARWDAQHEQYGLLPALLGTLITTAVALAIALPLAVSFAVFVNEVVPQRYRGLVSSFMDATASLPTVVYGLWGLTVLTRYIYEYFGTTTSLLTASLLLSIVITPYAAAIIREGYASIPREIVEAIYALGATKAEAIYIKLRYIKNYLLGGTFLAMGRAMGETVAVAMVVGGNYVSLPTNLLNSGVTISSLIALQFPNAQIANYMEPALMAAAFVLAAVGLAINTTAVYFLFRR